MKTWKKFATFTLLAFVTGYLLIHLYIARGTTYHGTEEWKEVRAQSVEQSMVERQPFQDSKEEQEKTRSKWNSRSVPPVVSINHSSQRTDPGILQNKGSSRLVSSDKRLKEVVTNIDKCLESTNLLRLKAAVARNAVRQIKEYGKVIPTNDHFINCPNRCWRTSFRAERQGGKWRGNLGNISVYEDINTYKGQLLHTEYRNGFTSQVVCLPKIFLAGFPKCGSSFLWCFLNRLIHQSEKIHVMKEPHFWVNAGAYKYFREPTAADFTNYIMNFAGGISLIEGSGCSTSGATLIDGSPNLMFNWPRFNTEDDNLTNYCLLPSTIPHFFPDAKFFVVMRNPVKMLYSAFWFSCTMYGVNLPPKVRLKGPSLFHDRVERKLDVFHECMRNESDPTISSICSLQDTNYDSCITKRLHLLDECVPRISFNIFSDELPNCGRSRVAMGLYFSHIRKWLSVVPREQFLFITLEELMGEPTKVAADIFRFLGHEKSVNVIKREALLASLCSKNSQSTIDYKSNPRLHIRNDTRIMLETFYRPFNRLLANLLQDTKFLWQ